MANYLGDPLHLGLYKKPVPRVAISIIPSSIESSPGQKFLTVITVQNNRAGASVVLTQSGDFIDANFDDTLLNTVAAAAAATTGVTFNVGTRRLTFAANFSGALTFLRTLTIDPTVGQRHILTLSVPLGAMVIKVATASFVTTPEPEPIELGEGTIGVNLASAEFGTPSSPTDSQGSTYQYPSVEDVEYFYQRGFRQFRVPFRWARMQPTLLGALRTADISKLDTLAAYIAAKGDALFIPDNHEYIGRSAQTDDGKDGTGNLTPAALADLWIRMATELRGGIRWTDYGSAVRIGLHNEPQSPSRDVDGFALSAADSWAAIEWRDFAKPTIALMRTGGVTQKILVSGAAWTGARSWITSGNAAAWFGQLPANCIFDIHQYLDADSSGTSPIATVGGGATRLLDFIAWARPQSYQAMIGEVGIADNPGMYTEASDMVSVMNNNSDVIESFTIWAGGPWWGTDYMYLVQPLNGTANPVDRPQMRFFMDFTLPKTGNVAPTDITITNTASSDLSVQGNVVGTLSVVDADVNDFHTFTLIDDAQGRFQVVGNQIQIGSNTARIPGQAYPITVRATDRGLGFSDPAPGTKNKIFTMPILAAPTISFSAVGATTVAEGSNFVLRVGVANPVPGTGFDFWVSGNVPAQMVGSWESVVRPPFEAAGWEVISINTNPTKMILRMGTTTVAGNVDVTWPTLADAQTEGANFQANFFLDRRSGVRFSNGGETLFGSWFIQDTSLTPGWAISVGAGSVFPGGTITTQIQLSNPAIGAKVTVTPSGVANDADFTASFDAAIAAAVATETGLTYNSGTNQLEVTGAWDGTLSFDRIVAIDNDPDETYIQTLSSPVASVIAVGQDVASVLIRQQQGTTTVNTISYYTGDTTNTSSLTSAGIKTYENSDGSLRFIAANTLVTGDNGLDLGPPQVNLIRNPRGVGGVVGTATLPTGWNFFTGAWRFDGAFVENGMPYTRITFLGGASTPHDLIIDGQYPGTGSGDAPNEVGKLFNWQFGIRSVSGGGFTTAAKLQGVNDAGAQVSGFTGDSLKFASNLVWLNASATFGSNVTKVMAFIAWPGTAAGSSAFTFDIFAPSMWTVPLQTGVAGLGPLKCDIRAVRPLLPPVGTVARCAADAMAVDLAFTPPSEGTFLLDFDSRERYGGECILSIFSDTNNYIKVVQHIYGALDLIVSVNGQLVVNKTNPITETAGGYITAGKRHKLELVYGLFDVRLALDGRLLCSASPATVPVVNTVRIGCDENGLNHARIRVKRLIYRNDLRDTDDLLLDTTKPGILGSPGVNLAGGEFGNLFPGVNRQNYFFNSATQTASSAGALYWVNAGIGHLRCPIKAGRAMPSIGGSLDTTSNVGALGNIGYMGLVDKQINDHYSIGLLQSILDSHDYGSYVVNQPGFTQVNALMPTAPWTTAAFIDYWEKLTIHFLGNPAILMFDLINEYYPGQAIIQQVVNAIAAIDPTRIIGVEGNVSSSISNWPASSDTIKDITHPVDTVAKIAFLPHGYYDKNNSGTYQNTYSGELGTPEVTLAAIVNFDNYRITNGLKNRIVIQDENGAPGDGTDWTLTHSNGIKIRHEHGIQVTAWLAGEAVGGASQNLEPTGNAGAKVDRGGLIALTRNRYQAPGVAIQDFVLSASTVVSGTAAGTTIGNVTASNGGTITGLTLVDNVGNRFALTALALKTGSVATDFATAQQHVIVLNGLIDGVTRTQSLTITVTQVVTTPAVFLLPQGDNIVSGSPAGTLISPVTSSNGAPITSLALSDTAGNRFAISGLNLVAGAVATDYSVTTSHSITMTGLIGGVSTTTVFPSMDVTPAAASREFFLSANFIQSGAVQGTLIGLVQSNDGIVSNLTLSDSAGNRFQIGANNQLEAGSVATTTLTTHSITIDGLIGGQSSSTTLTVTVTSAASVTLVVVNSEDDIVAGSPPGTHVSTIVASNGAAVTGLNLTNTAGNRFAMNGNEVVAGSVATTYPGDLQIALQGFVGGVSKTLSYFIVVQQNVSQTYLLSASSVTSGAAPGVFVGALSGSGGGALTGLSLTQNAGNRFALSGNNIVTGATATDFNTVTSHLITLAGFIAGVAHTQDFTIAVNSTGFGLTNLGVLRLGGNNNPMARNIHDLFTSGLRIWGGTGDSANNDGSGDLRYINLANDTIVTSTYLAAAINEEQAERFKFIDGAVTFPGIDPGGSGPPKYHREESGVWTSHNVAPSGSPNERHHCCDVYKFNNMWFASLGTDNNTPVGYWDIFVKTTDPTGVTGWAPTQTSVDVIAARGGTFFEHSGSLYCGVYFSAGSGQQGRLPTGDGYPAACVKWNGTKFSLTGALTRSQLFPGIGIADGGTELFAAQIQRPINVGTYLIYVSAWGTSDANWLGRWLYVATANFATITKVPLLAAEVSWDTLVRGSTAYVLTSQLKSSNPQVFTIRVRSSVAPFTTWTEIVNFDQPTFARSFEEYSSAYYLGLGTDVGTALENGGSEGSTRNAKSYTDVQKVESGQVLKWTPAVAPPPPADVTVALTLGNTHQTMQGFGASERVLDDPHLWNNFNSSTGRSLTTMTQAQKNDIYDKLYVDLKLTRVRVSIDEGIEYPNNDNADPLVTDLSKFTFAWKAVDDHAVWVQAAKARGAVTAWGSPYLPEPWMSEAMDKREYIEHAMVVLNRFRSLGAELDYWAPCNEPGYNRYPRSAVWYRDIIKLLGPAIAAAGMSTKIVAADDIRATNTTALSTTILNDATAKSYVTAIATHLYDESVSNMTGLKNLAATHNKPVWMTEFEISLMGSAGISGTPFNWAKLMHDLIATYDVTAVDYMWGAFGDWTGGGDSLIQLNDTGGVYQGYTLQKVYYMFGQYSRFVPVGAVRVDAVSDDATVLVSAFKSGAAITIVAINNSASSPSVAFTGLTGKTSVSVVRTSTTEDWAVRTPIAVSGAAFTAVLTPNSVTTFMTP